MNNTPPNGYFPKANPDRLSELPDALRVEILSLLPITEAVRTGVLSTRWKNLWNHIDKLVFGCPRLENPISFISSVDRILMQCSCKKIKTFWLYMYEIDEDHFDHKVLDRWLQWVFSRNVEFLKVDICPLSYVPQQWFYNNSALVKLDIKYWNITIHGPVVTWSLLQSLSMAHLTIGDEDIANILSGCPVLENLDLEQVSGFSRLNIMSPRLVKLKVDFEQHDEEDFLEINAPWLQFLGLQFSDISEYSYDCAIRLINVSALVHANLEITYDSSISTAHSNDGDLFLDVATKLLQSVHHVEELTFGPLLIQALSMLKLLGRPCPLFKCKQLKVHLTICKYELPGLTYLLQSSPHLETLFIEAGCHDEEEIHPYLVGICDLEGALYLSMENVEFMNLKSIEVVYDKNAFLSDEPRISDKVYFDFELVAYILRKAPALEKLTITQQEGFCECSRKRDGEQVSMLSHKLLQFFSDHEQAGEWKLRKKKSSHFEIIFS